MTRTNVSVDIKSLEVDDPSKILAAIEAQQMATVGTRYLYCSVCQLPVRPSTAQQAKKAGKQHMCKRCSLVWMRAQRTVRDPNVYLCANANCRIPLTGKHASLARYSSVIGMRASCGNADCRGELSRQARAARAKPLEKCVICGQDATRKSSHNTRVRGLRAYCDKHKGGKNAKPLEKCVICGQDATRKSSYYARVRGLRAYCDKHKRGGKEREKCVICGQDATRNSSYQARVRGSRAYCDKHKGGKPSAT